MSVNVFCPPADRALSQRELRGAAVIVSARGRANPWLSDHLAAALHYVRGEDLAKAVMGLIGSFLQKATKVAARQLFPEVYSYLEFGKYAKTWIHPRISNIEDYYTPSLILGH